MSEKLKQYRDELDEIDEEIVSLFERRMHLSEAVAEDKIASGKPVLDRKREQEKLATLSNLTDTAFNKQGITELYGQIMALSRKRQYQMLGAADQIHGQSFIQVETLADERTRVAYQGAPGAYSEAAMRKFFGGHVDNIHVDTFRDAMISIEEGAADYAVLPIENSSAGIVAENYDLLSEFENYIVGEEIIPIRHCLMAVEGASEQTIRTVYSHPQSLMQSERFLNMHPDWEQVGMQNNAYAAQKVARDQDITKAAIASVYAAELNGLKILRQGINSSGSNSTRFLVITNRKVFLKSARKISIIIECLHESGSLYKALSHFIYNNLNMVKIESRPVRDRSFEYRFFIDFEGNLEEPAVRSALRGLRDDTKSLKVLGNY